MDNSTKTTTSTPPIHPSTFYYESDSERVVQCSSLLSISTVFWVSSGWHQIGMVRVPLQTATAQELRAHLISLTFLFSHSLVFIRALVRLWDLEDLKPLLCLILSLAPIPFFCLSFFLSFFLSANKFACMSCNITFPLSQLALPRLAFMLVLFPSKHATMQAMRVYMSRVVIEDLKEAYLKIQHPPTCPCFPSPGMFFALLPFYYPLTCIFRF